MSTSTTMFEFLQNMEYYGDPTITTYLETCGFTENDDIMRLLEVDTTGLTGDAKSKIDFIQTQAKLPGMHWISRVFLEELELELKKKKQQTRDFVKCMNNNNKARLAEKDSEIKELKIRIAEQDVEIQKLQIRNQKHETRLAAKDPYLADTDCKANPYCILNLQPEPATTY